MTRRGLLAGLVLAGGIALGAPLAALAADAGKVGLARGTVLVHGADGTARVVTRGDGVVVGDTVSTGAGAFVLLVLADDSRIVLRPGSTFRIEALDTGPSLAAAFELLRGGLRAVTGAIGRRDPRAVRFRTPVATIGIRGTAFDARLCAADCTADNGGDGAVAEGLYAAVREGAVVLVQGGQELVVGAGRAARANAAGMDLLPAVPVFLQRDATPLPETAAENDAQLRGFVPAADLFRTCTVDGVAVFEAGEPAGAAGPAIARSNGARAASPIPAGTPAALAGLDIAPAAGGAVTPDADTRINSGSGRPPGSNLNTDSGGGGPREFPGNDTRREAPPPKYSEATQRYINEQQNEGMIVYREQDAVRDHHAATSERNFAAVADAGTDAFRAEREIQLAKGATQMEAAAAAARAGQAARQRWADSTLLDQAVATGLVDAETVSGLDPTLALRFGLTAEEQAQRAGLKGGKDVLRVLSEEELEKLKENIRKALESDEPDAPGKAVDEATKTAIGMAFQQEFGVSVGTLAARMRKEAMGPPSGSPKDGGPPSGANPTGNAGGGAQQFHPDNVSTLGGDPSPDASASTDPGNSPASPGTSDQGSNPVGTPPPSGTTTPGGAPSGTDANPGAGPGSGGGNDALPPGDYVNVSSNADGGFTITQYQVGDDGTVTRSVSETYHPDGQGGYQGENGGHTGGQPSDGTYSVTYGEQNADGSTSVSLAPVSAGGGDQGGNSNGGGTDNAGSGGSGTASGGGSQGEGESEGEGNNDCAAGQDCGQTTEEKPAEEEAPAEEPPAEGRPNPMADDPVNTAMEIYLDVVLGQGQRTRQQVRAIELAAGGAVTNPGDDPNATGAGGSTSPELDIKHIGVVGGGGVDGGRGPLAPEQFNALDLKSIALQSGGAVTDPPREGEDGGAVTILPMGAGGTPGVVGPEPALRGATGFDAGAAAATFDLSNQLRN